jgi:hypothetical protein
MLVEQVQHQRVSSAALRFAVGAGHLGEDVRCGARLHVNALAAAWVAASAGRNRVQTAARCSRLYQRMVRYVNSKYTLNIDVSGVLA